MSSFPSRVLLKAIRPPSGDHEGQLFAPPPVVTWVGSEPSAFITQMLSRLWNAIRPSGDQAGARSSYASEFVRFVRPVPSPFITKMSGLCVGVRSDQKAIRVPSGDQSGSET